jgi:hypothetical protein
MLICRRFAPLGKLVHHHNYPLVKRFKVSGSSPLAGSLPCLGTIT